MSKNMENRFELQQEKEVLEKLLRKLKKENKIVPEGSLRVIKSKGRYPQYYQYQSEEENQEQCLRYLPKKEMKLVQKLAQKQYDKEVMNCLEKRIKAIGTIDAPPSRIALSTISNYENGNRPIPTCYVELMKNSSLLNGLCFQRTLRTFFEVHSRHIVSLCSSYVLNTLAI